ncbi:MAG TPA: NIPSNAP family protein [Anditalea sp.]|nr:NIPSNAP family protein [Anditalea sp.]
MNSKYILITCLCMFLFFYASLSHGQEKQNQEYYELRTYSLSSEDQLQDLEEYFKNAAIPTYNKLGIEAIGVFNEMEKGDNQKLYVLIPYKSLQQYDDVQRQFLQQVSLEKAGLKHLDAPFTAPAYDRVESSLMRAFTHLPIMEIPDKSERIFELRIYESHSEKFGQQKIKMFNEGGEFDIFREVGLQPVFFGETLIGAHMPNLTYMITAPNMDAHKENWKKFGGHPDWKTLSGLAEYKDTVSKIHSIFLVPTDFSQI